MIIYRIKNWDSLYENNRTRDMKQMFWVPIPNKHDSDGYTTLVQRRNGAAYYGAWITILQVASKCEPRGTLVRCGTSSPHDSNSLSRITRMPQSLIEATLSVCLNECKWLEIIDGLPQIPHPTAEKTHPTAEKVVATPQEGAGPTHLTDDGMEGNGRERKGVTPCSPPDGGQAQGEFTPVEEAYPKEQVPNKGPLQLRAEKLMRRRPETPLTANEQRAFKRNKAAIQATTEEEWDALEKFYAAPQEETYTRKDLATLLNNWNGEIDRAKAWVACPTARKPKVPLTDQLKALEALIAEHPCRPGSVVRGDKTDAQRDEYRKLKADCDAVKKLIAAGGQNT